MKIKLRNSKIIFQSVAERKVKYVNVYDGTYNHDYPVNGKTSIIALNIKSLLGNPIVYGKDYTLELEYETPDLTLSSVSFVRKTSEEKPVERFNGSVTLTDVNSYGSLKAAFNFTAPIEGATESLCALSVVFKDSVTTTFTVKNVKLYYYEYE